MALSTENVGGRTNLNFEAETWAISAILPSRQGLVCQHGVPSSVLSGGFYVSETPQGGRRREERWRMGTTSQQSWASTIHHLCRTKTKMQSPCAIVLALLGRLKAPHYITSLPSLAWMRRLNRAMLITSSDPDRDFTMPLDGVANVTRAFGWGSLCGYLGKVAHVQRRRRVKDHVVHRISPNRPRRARRHAARQLHAL